MLRTDRSQLPEHLTWAFPHSIAQEGEKRNGIARQSAVMARQSNVERCHGKELCGARWLSQEWNRKVMLGNGVGLLGII